MKTAVLLTCFNRKTYTISCLERVTNLRNDFDIYVVDDNSSDGTYEYIRDHFKDVTLIRGNGNLFWNRGMHLAWKVASKKDYDFYIWMNDDINLYDNCFDELFDCYNFGGKNTIISGIIESDSKSEILYGGTSSEGKLIKPNGHLQFIRKLNGNLVLVPKEVFKVLGNLDHTFHHDLGDVEYGLRALKNGIKVYSSRCPVASGNKNNICRERLNNVNIYKRFKRLYSPLGSNPVINFYFRKKYLGFANAITYFGFQHFLNLIPDAINKIVFKQKYV